MPTVDKQSGTKSHMLLESERRHGAAVGHQTESLANAVDWKHMVGFHVASPDGNPFFSTRKGVAFEKEGSFARRKGRCKQSKPMTPREQDEVLSGNDRPARCDRGTPLFSRSQRAKTSVLVHGA